MVTPDVSTPTRPSQSSIAQSHQAASRQRLGFVLVATYVGLSPGLTRVVTFRAAERPVRNDDSLEVSAVVARVERDDLAGRKPETSIAAMKLRIPPLLLVLVGAFFMWVGQPGRAEPAVAV